MRGKVSKSVLVGAIVLAIASNVALSQTTSAPAAPVVDNDELGEVVVTAQRRAENAQKVPLALSVVGATALQDRNITDLSEVSQLVPNLNLAEVQGRARITMRGVGLDSIAPGVEGAVAFHTDNVYISRSAAAFASFYDIDRIEVLRGPQGTLYGRNATGGTINVITARPTEDTEGYAKVTFGDYSTVNTEAAISGPVVGDEILGRLSVQTQHHEGYNRNIVTGDKIDGKDSQAARGQLAFKPTDKLSVRLSVDFYRDDSSAGGYHSFGAGGRTATGAVIPTKNDANGGTNPTDIRDIAADQDPNLNQRFYGGLVDVSYELGLFTLKSLTSARETQNDLDYSIVLGTLSRYAQGSSSEHADQFSQEFQASASTDRNKFVAGLYYFHENNFGYTAFPFSLKLFGGPDVLKQGYFSGGRLLTDAAAVYSQDTYSLLDDLRLTVGGRYSVERKKVNERSMVDLTRNYNPDNPLMGTTGQNQATFHSFTPKFGIDYDLTQNVLLYASYSKGFKSGTFSLGSLLPPLRPEQVKAYELGEKATLFGGHLRTNLALFWYNYSDLQVGKVVNNIVSLENAATARIKGAELEVIAQPFEAPFTVSVSPSYLDARFTNYITSDPSRLAGDGHTVDEFGAPAFNLSGNYLSQAPKFKLNVGAEYTVPAPGGHVSLRAETVYTTRVYFSSYNLPFVSQGPYAITNAFVNYETSDGRWETGAYIRNMFDKTVAASATVLGSIPGFPIAGYLEPPLTFGVSLRYRF
jgi:iron complex outermembrane receptor protein